MNQDVDKIIIDPAKKKEIESLLTLDQPRHELSTDLQGSFEWRRGHGIPTMKVEKQNYFRLRDFSKIKNHDTYGPFYDIIVTYYKSDEKEQDFIIAIKLKHGSEEKGMKELATKIITVSNDEDEKIISQSEIDQSQEYVDELAKIAVNHLKQNYL